MCLHVRLHVHERDVSMTSGSNRGEWSRQRERENIKWCFFHLRLSPSSFRVARERSILSVVRQSCAQLPSPSLSPQPVHPYDFPYKTQKKTFRYLPNSPRLTSVNALSFSHSISGGPEDIKIYVFLFSLCLRKFRVMHPCVPEHYFLQ